MKLRNDGLVTHDRMEAMRLSERIAVMKDGKILQFAPPGELINQPADEFVASFVGVQTILEGTVAEQNDSAFRALVAGREIDCGFPLVAYVTEESCQNQCLAKGAPITASFKTSAVRIIRAA